MTIPALLVVLLIGAIAGWLAGLVVKGAGFGLLGNVVVGIVGAFVASFLLPVVGIQIGTGTLSSIVHATIGAIVVLVLFRVMRSL
jgi:uncharacterized membrane protein YeaQ/YmgE (transglycosylase-associated protein family)